nr:hypothetical protein CFP56_57023 [Quercus suber]
MDWTGGTRRRFAGGKGNTIVQKQKEYFATARNRLGHKTASQRSFHPDFLHGTTGREQQISPRVDHKSAKHVPLHSRYEYRTASARCRPPFDLDKDNAHENENENEALVHHSDTRRDLSLIGEQDFNSPANSSSLHTPRKHPASHSTRLDGLVKSNMADNDLTILRKRLLAKDDWLGLRAKRPLQYHVPAHSDKSRIGKRRKISHPTPGRRPVREGCLSPLFMQRLRRPEYVMSGGLPDEQIKVRIGTDALVSQTQVSKRSHTPGQTSLRAPSTDLECLSDPVLGGQDGDIFESGRFARTVAYQDTDQGGAETQELSQCNVDNSDSSRTPDVPWAPSIELTPAITVYDDATYYMEPNSWSSALTLEQYDMLPAVDHAFQYPGSPIDEPKSGCRTDLDRHGRVERIEAMYASTRADQTQTIKETPPAVPCPIRSVEEDGDDDCIWRDLMSLQHNASGHDSVFAVKSSSKHLTASAISSRMPVLRRDDILERGPFVSTPQGAGTQQSNITRPEHPVENRPRENEALVLATNNRGAQQGYGRAAVDGLERHHDNDLWKTFVGLNSSSDLMSVHDLITLRRPSSAVELIDGIQPPATSSMLDVSGLGTSDMATMGGSTQVQCPTSLSSTVLSERTLVYVDPSVAQADCDSSLGSLCDEIEEATPDPTCNRGHQMKALSQLNVKRFKAPARSAETTAWNVGPRRPVWRYKR